MRDVARWRALTAEERRLLAAACVLLPLVAASVRLAGFERTRSMLARWPRRPGGRTPSASRVQTVARIVAIAGRRGIVRATCVPRALVTWWMLRRDGIDVAIRIGVRLDGEALRAHAWIEHLGRPVEDGAATEGLFAAFEGDLASPGARPA